MLEVNELSVGYGKEAIISNASFRLGYGLYALMGLNGSGKTTLLYALAGIIPSYIKGWVRGTISVFGASPSSFKDKHFVFQDVEDSLIMPTVKEELCFSSANCKNIARFIRLEKKLSFPISSLSHGEKHRLAVGVGIARKAKLILLDEALNSLDCPSLFSLLRLLKHASKRAIVIFSTHSPKLAKEADNLLIISDKRVYVGKHYMKSLKEFKLDC